MIKAIVELIRFILGIFKDSYDRQLAEKDKREALNAIPLSPNQKANNDIQELYQAIVDDDVVSIMRKYEQLREAAYTYNIRITTAADSRKVDNNS